MSTLVPEIPDLENIKAFLNGVLPGAKVTGVETRIPLVIRRPIPQEFAGILEGNAFREVTRRGKFLVFHTASGHIMAINAMLTGHLQYTGPETRRHAKTCFVLSLENGMELRYYDGRLMGKVYLVPRGQEALIPRFEDMGPDALDPEITLEVFRKRLRRHSGQIKGILVKDTFIAGIGNAYSDEILFEAGVYPFRRRPTLTEDEIEALYNSIDLVLREATETIGQRMNGRIDLKIRDFLKIHRKGQQPCPRCGHRIGEVKANQRLTNFCRNCQR
jgi:formamidopyrimidine-DNA glycosylase